MLIVVFLSDLDKLSEPADLPPGYTEGQLASLHGSRSGLQPSRSGLLSRPALQGSRAGLQGSRAGLQGPGQQDSPTGLQANRSVPLHRMPGSQTVAYIGIDLPGTVMIVCMGLNDNVCVIIFLH